jgi:hypothetical protein
MGGWRRLRLRWRAVFVSLEKVRGVREGRGAEETDRKPFRTGQDAGIAWISRCNGVDGSSDGNSLNALAILLRTLQ